MRGAYISTENLKSLQMQCSICKCSLGKITPKELEGEIAKAQLGHPSALDCSKCGNTAEVMFTFPGGKTTVKP